MGLLGGIARTAVIAGTATAVSNNVSRRQQGRWAQREQAQAYQQQPQYQQPVYQQAPQPVYAAPQAAPASDAMDNRLAQLKQLADLKDQGILTQAEFDAQKAKVLAG